MLNSRRSPAFTLIEVLIVVIIMAVLAATVIPHFSSVTKDAKTSSVEYNLRNIRSQIEYYKHEHLKYPDGDAAKFMEQMTKKTDADGAVDPAGPYGPYIQDSLPVNAFNGSNAVAIVADDTEPAKATGGNEGWQYNPAHGWFYPNNAEYFQH